MRYNKVGISWQEIRIFAKHFGLGIPLWESEADGFYRSRRILLLARSMRVLSRVER